MVWQFFTIFLWGGEDGGDCKAVTYRQQQVLVAIKLLLICKDSMYEASPVCETVKSEH